uniref:Uncharacterized protein n=1 Tax=Vitis vinifera TaxID=29760 RepID=F6GVC4_VITVI
MKKGSQMAKQEKFLIVLNLSKSEHFHQVRQQATDYHQANSRCRA